MKTLGWPRVNYKGKYGHKHFCKKKKYCKNYHIPLLNIITVIRIFGVFKNHVKRYTKIQKKTFQDLESMALRAINEGYLTVNVDRAFIYVYCKPKSCNIPRLFCQSRFYRLWL